MAGVLFKAMALGAMAAAVVARPAWANDRDTAFARIVEQYEKKAEAIGNEALRRKTPHAGSMFNEFRVQEFTCASLAYLLGKDEIFKRLSHIDESALKLRMADDELMTLAIDAIAHSNRASAARAALASSGRDRIELWNLNCVGQHAIGREHVMGRTAPKATFEREADRIFVLGDIDTGFFERFRAFVESSNGVRTIVLGSGGGSVRDAIMAGRFIRGVGLKTTLFADCYSACPLIFLGGVDRTISSPYPRLGFHQVSAEGRAVAFDHEVYTLIRDYAQNMGANGAHVLNLMHRSKPTELNYPPVWDLCSVGITTWVQRGC